MLLNQEAANKQESTIRLEEERKTTVSNTQYSTHWTTEIEVTILKQVVNIIVYPAMPYLKL